MATEATWCPISAGVCNLQQLFQALAKTNKIDFFVCFLMEKDQFSSLPVNVINNYVIDTATTKWNIEIN